MSKTRSFQNIHPVTTPVTESHAVIITLTSQESQTTLEPTATKCDLLHSKTRSGVYSSIIASYPPYFFLHKHKHFCYWRKSFVDRVSIQVMYSQPQVWSVMFLWEFNKISDCFTFLLTLSAQREEVQAKHTALTFLYWVDGPPAPRREVSTESKLIMFSTMSLDLILYIIGFDMLFSVRKNHCLFCCQLFWANYFC